MGVREFPPRPTVVLAVVTGSPGAYELAPFTAAEVQELVQAVEAREAAADTLGHEPIARACRLLLHRLRPCLVNQATRRGGPRA